MHKPRKLMKKAANMVLRNALKIDGSENMSLVRASMRDL